LKGRLFEELKNLTLDEFLYIKGWLPVSAVTKVRVGNKFLSGSIGVTFAKGLTDKELLVLAVLKGDKSAINFWHSLPKIRYL
jgi:hypothetical protein